MTTPFGDRLAQAMADHGPVCVGIDPHPTLLDAWNLPRSADGVRRFGLRLVEALGGRIGACKPQAAFFEEYGSGGVAALEEVIAACRATDTLCIVDAKRGDIGSTMAGYARAYLDTDSALSGDAVTLSPYLGVGSLAPAFEAAAANGKGIFVLALTSNPEGARVQHARMADGTSVAQGVIEAVQDANQACDYRHMGSFGLVVGATIGDAPQQLGISFNTFNGPILAPGVGAQGAGNTEVTKVFRESVPKVLASSSRVILQAGPSIDGLRRAYRQCVDEIVR
ncbi:orotidine-5'-phosphate decarboxylase [Schaalia suimastitidis]|uniref:orotidine-5'-phosphate decarboxylase n=1 Tax=Schaalia suimastitidis TaxID=121163 RepID=UPI000407C69F|nr:orotidine-5'-phosphate decarboxylase [Schaalia suimastitidis]